MYTDSFAKRHIGPNSQEISEMLKVIGVDSIEELISQALPESIRTNQELDIPEGISEYELINELKEISKKNLLYRSFIGQGYNQTKTPPVIQRNIFENPGWYTSYTPYQAEISQGRLEALLLFQTMIISLTGMELSNCSLLDEATATAEAMIMMFNSRPRKLAKAGYDTIFIDKSIYKQTLDVVEARSRPLGIKIVYGDVLSEEMPENCFGTLVQYPNSNGEISDYKAFTEKAHENNALVTVVVDTMSLALLTPPGEWDADIVAGSTQRFGIPMGYGGPHAGYLASKETFKRNLPGRIIGVSLDRHGNRALRMALQTREQHIKREKATSNICTAQALLASMAAMYSAYHGQEGITNIAKHIHSTANAISNGITALGFEQINKNYFDTVRVKVDDVNKIRQIALDKCINLNYQDGIVTISTDECITQDEISKIISIFAEYASKEDSIVPEITENTSFDNKFARKSEILKEAEFNTYHSETEMMRYITKLERRDISLTHSMIALGSCTMKLNPAASLIPISWPEFANIHPFVPMNQVDGYTELINRLDKHLSVITGFAAMSFQPNSGASGEYTGLMVIRAYHKSRGESNRNVILIPSSAHGTNPASAVMAGMKIIIVKCDEKGNIDIEDLKQKAEDNKDNLAGFMVTYPSTHGVFEARIIEMNNIIHDNGGQVFMDGANMNAQVGLTSPGFIGADVCHLNLHKTFAIPHGGGGPGVGPIGVAEHLKDFLPGHSIVNIGTDKAIQAVSSAPYGSASILPITYSYIRMLGKSGLTEATKMAIVNANYIACALKGTFEVVYSGETGRCAHEMILDCRDIRKEYGVETGDIARRLMDYGFHAPTLSFPVHETLMVEPTESEPKSEIDRFIETMKLIRKELEEIKSGDADKDDNPLKNAPHTAAEIVGDWDHKYSREKAVYPMEIIKEYKFWPYVSRIDNAYGDRNLICTCAPTEDYM